MLKPDSIVCIGNDGDVWQQEAKTMLNKYDLVQILSDGWMIFRPKPGINVPVAEVTADIVDGEFDLVAKWGREVDGKFLQTGRTGDFIGKSTTDPNDFWVIAQKVFSNTYEPVVT